MKPRIFHIFNGDASLQLADLSDLEGPRLSWREALAEGPVSAQFCTKNFFSARKAYWQLAAGELPASYTLDTELMQTGLPDSFDEVALWFEYDWFCQINLIGVLKWLHTLGVSGTSCQVSLICPGAFPGKPHFRGLGDLSPSEMVGLFPERTQLSAGHLRDAAACWDAWSAGDYAALAATVSAMDLQVFPHLARAFEAHKLQYPSKINGLSRIEMELFQNCDGVLTARQVVGKMLQKHNWLGFGDLYYFNLLGRRLGLLKSWEDLPSLTPFGHSIIKNDGFAAALPANSPCEFAIRNWVWDPLSDKIHPTT